MRFSKIIGYLFAAALLVISVAPSLADRKPTDDERVRIEAALREQGYTRWGEIELNDDDETWEVDDAVAGDGREYDLTLDKNFAVIARDED